MGNLFLQKESYERFSALIEREIYLRKGCGFGKLCRIAGVQEKYMDNALKAELGLGGNAFVRALRNQKGMHFDKRF